MSKAPASAEQKIQNALNVSGDVSQQTQVHPAEVKSSIAAKPEALKKAAEESSKPVKKKLVLQVSRFALQGSLHNKWDVTAEAGTTLEDVLETDYWKHVAAQIRPHDEITVIAEDGSWRAVLFVVGADRLWARVYKLEYHDLTAAYEGMPKTQEEEYNVLYSSIKKFYIFKKGNEGMPPLKDGFQTRLEAYQWLDGYLKTLNG